MNNMFGSLLHASAISCIQQDKVSWALGDMLRSEPVKCALRSKVDAAAEGVSGKWGHTVVDSLQLARDHARLPQLRPLLEQLSRDEKCIPYTWPELAGAFVAELRSHLCSLYGLSAYSTTAWQALLGANSFVADTDGDLQQAGNDSDSESLWEVQGVAGAAAAAIATAAPSPSSGWDSPCTSSSSSNSRAISGQWHSPEAMVAIHDSLIQVYELLPTALKQQADLYRDSTEATMHAAADTLR
jgi:hypothetical protein